MDMGMDPLLRLQIELGVHLLFITVMTVFLAYIFVNSKRPMVLYSYCFMHAMLILLFIADFASLFAPDVRSRWVCIAVTYIIKLLYDILFIFRYAFMNGFKKKFLLTLITAYVISGAVLILTNPLHRLFITEMTAQGSTCGIFFYVLIGAGYCLQTGGIILIAKSFIGKLDNFAFRVFSSIVALAGILFLHLFLIKATRIADILFPALILACFTVYFTGVCKYSMFDTISGGSKQGFEMFTDALLVIDKKRRIMYKNKACGLIEEKTLMNILDRFVPDLECKPAKWMGSKMDVEIPEADEVKYFSVSVKPIKRRIFASAKTLIIIHENTEIISAIDRLSDKNQFLQDMNENIKMLSEDTKKLAILSERNLLAKEIHDVMGHSLILALNTMESNKLLRGDRSVALRRIEQAISEINGSVNEIASAVNQESALKNTADPSFSENPDKVFNALLAEKLRMLAVRLSGTGILLEIAAMDDLSGCNESMVNTIYRVCQESVTNAIKHGQASRITISIKKKPGKVELFIVDNGRGSTSFTKGTGLTGMEERIKELRGTISFRSFEDQNGFLVCASIPVLD